MPSSSARCAQLPRALDKVPFYVALKKFRDFLKGDIPTLDDDEIIFSNVKLKNFTKEEPKLEEEFDYEQNSNESEEATKYMSIMPKQEEDL